MLDSDHRVGLVFNSDAVARSVWEKEKHLAKWAVKESPLAPWQAGAGVVLW